MEEHRLGGQMLEAVNLHLQSKGVRIATGTIVDATIIHAPTSTKNREQKRDPEMHQTKKGNQWYFGMKAHVGVDSKTKLIHSALATPANVADATVLPELLHGEETRVWGDQAYRRVVASGGIAGAVGAGKSIQSQEGTEECLTKPDGKVAPSSWGLALPQSGPYPKPWARPKKINMRWNPWMVI